MNIVLIKDWPEYYAQNIADAQSLLTALQDQTDTDNLETISRIQQRAPSTFVQSDSGEPLVIDSIDDTSGTRSGWVTDVTKTLAFALGDPSPSTDLSYTVANVSTIAANVRTGTLALNTTDLQSAVGGWRGHPQRGQSPQFLGHIRHANVSTGLTETVGRIAFRVLPGVITSSTTTSDIANVSLAADYASQASASAAAALVSENNAETAETNAETAETNAETAQAAAELAETNAETSATEAAASAVDATTNGAAQVTLAAAQVALATTQADNAETSATEAATSASQASTSATNAATSATAAATSASQAASITGCGSGNFGGTVALVGLTTLTGHTATNVTITGGSTGASLVLGQGANGGMTATPAGTGTFLINRAGTATVGAEGTYALRIQGGSSQTHLTFGSDASYAYIQSWAARPLQINNQGNSVLIGAAGGNVLIGGTTDITGSGGLKIFGTTAATNTLSGAFQCLGGGSFVKEVVAGLGLWLVDGITAPSATTGYAKLFVDTADGDLKIIFGDGTVKTISIDT